MDPAARSRRLTARAGAPVRRHRSNAGQEGLEPTTAGFGDRCAANCATALRGGRHPGSLRAGTGHHGGRQPPGCECTHSGARGRTGPGREVRDPRPSRTARVLSGSEPRSHRASATMGPVTENSPAAAPRRRVSARLAAIAESATLAVDAKAKALKAAGRPVIGFGAGEPDFPTPDYIVDAAIAAASDPVEPSLHPGRRPARAARGHRGQDAARLRLRGRGRPGARHQRRQAGRLPGVRRDRGPGRRGAPARALLDHLPRGHLAGRRAAPSRSSPGWTRSYLVTVEQLEAARTDRTKALLFCSPSNPTGAVYSPEQTEAIGRWALEHGIWVITDEIYEHLAVRRRACSHRSSRWCPELADTDDRPQRRREDLRDDRLARGLDDRPGRRHQGRDQPAVAPHVERRERLPARGDRRARRRPVRRRGDARGVRPPPQDDGRDAARRSTASCARRRRVPSTPTRASRVSWARRSAGRPRPRPPSSPRSSSTRSRSRSCPARPSARAGYLRLSYALGDDDLVEGVTRIQNLLAEAR